MQGESLSIEMQKVRDRFNRRQTSGDNNWILCDFMD